MDNRSINVKLEGKIAFSLSMRIACFEHPKIVGWSIWEDADKAKCLVLYWTKSDKAILFPFEMNVEEIIEFAWGWLSREPIAYKEPDHDGNNGRGFNMFTHSWGMVNSDYAAFVGIKPIWAMYGK